VETIVLVVDDERCIADGTAMMLERKGYCALSTYSAAEAIEILRKVDVALIISDINMPGGDGIELALEAREACPRTKILLMSGIETAETISRRAGCQGCPFQVLAKPFDSRQLLDRVERLLN
jgi:two-component system response regulator HydG